MGEAAPTGQVTRTVGFLPGRPCQHPPSAFLQKDLPSPRQLDLTLVFNLSKTHSLSLEAESG